MHLVVLQALFCRALSRLPSIYSRKPLKIAKHLLVLWYVQCRKQLKIAENPLIFVFTNENH